MQNIDCIVLKKAVYPQKRPNLKKAIYREAIQLMKKDIHPSYHEITLILTDGEKRTIRSTYGKPGDTIQLDIDPKSHPAWTGQQRTFDKGGKIERFKDRYGSLGSL